MSDRRRVRAERLTPATRTLRAELAARYRRLAEGSSPEPLVDQVLRHHRAAAARTADLLEAGEPFVAPGWAFDLSLAAGDYVLEPNGDLVPVERVHIDSREVRFRRPDGTFTHEEH